MKTKFILLAAFAALLGCWSAASMAATPTQVAQFQANGSYADASIYTADGMWGSLWVSQSNPKGAKNTQTFLSYNTGKCTGDWWSTYTCTWGWGYGSIPSTAFQVNGQKASLNFDTSTSTSGFYSYSYTETCTVYWDPDWWWYNWNCSYSENPASSGLIAMTWKQNPYYRGEWAGSNSNNYGRYSYRVAGQSSYSTATPAGSFLGSDLSDGNWGNIGKYHNTTISIMRNR